MNDLSNSFGTNTFAQPPNPYELSYVDRGAATSASVNIGAGIGGARSSKSYKRMGDVDPARNIAEEGGLKE